MGACNRIVLCSVPIPDFLAEEAEKLLGGREATLSHTFPTQVSDSGNLGAEGDGDLGFALFFFFFAF